MFEVWDKAIISSVRLAMYVPAGSGDMMHYNRAAHGFVINDTGAEKDYIFSDGTVLRTHGGDVFYLPKGSNYRVQSKTPGGCYAINFETVEKIDCAPFFINFRDGEAILKCFKSAEKAWRQRPEYYRSAILKNIYQIINLIGKELQRDYITNEKESQISSAVEKIHSSFTDNELSVAELARMSGITEAYFRRLFNAKFGISPKEYINRLRIRYAKRLLESGDFSVNTVATLCGYREPCHFSREFKKHTGISPSKFK